MYSRIALTSFNDALRLLYNPFSKAPHLIFLSFSTFFCQRTVKYGIKSKNQAEADSFQLWDHTNEVMTIIISFRLTLDSLALQDVFKNVLKTFWDYDEATFASETTFIKTIF